MAAPLGNKNAVGNEGGAPTKYDPKYNDQVYKLCLLGADDHDIANFFNVHVNTVINWRKAEVEFLESCKKGKEEADQKVAESTYKRALGYEYTEEHTSLVADGLGKPKIKEKKTIKRQMAPDVTAQIFWLKNRQPRFWKDKQEVEHSGTGITIQTTTSDQSKKLQELEEKLKKVNEAD